MPSTVHAAGFAPDLVERLVDLALADRTPFAIAGVPGSGKSTLAADIARRAGRRGERVAVLSLDDVYLDRPARRRLARDVHPLLATRGPPGTHDVALALEVLDALRDGRDVPLPRFDKLADRRVPVSQWPRVGACDLVIVEGWCLKVPPQASPSLDTPLNALERDEDADGRWRRACNEALAHDYPALWARLPRLVLLEAPGFDVVPHWRWEQERHAVARRRGGDGMSRAQVERFVQHFERVCRHALDVLPALADLRIRLDARRRVVDVIARTPPTIGA